MNIDILSPEQKDTLLGILNTTKKAVVVTHKSPDGDALGSSLSWTEFIRKCYDIDTTIIIPDQYPDFLKWLPDSDKLVRYDKHPDEVLKALDEADTIFCLDMNVASRVCELEEPLLAAKARKVMIDHHLEPDLDVVLGVSEPEMSSTSEIVFRIVYQIGGFEDMDRKWAAQVYCGMMTDTGGFTFNSTRPEIYFIISELLTKGIDKDRIYRNVFNNYSHWAIRLRGHLMSQKLNYIEDMHASYFAISRMDVEEYHFRKGDAEGLVNIPLSIKGMKLSISLREDTQTDNVVWVSLRSVDDFPCNEMAAQFFNGGGHKNASGGRLDCSLDEACKIAREAIRTWAHLLKD